MWATNIIIFLALIYRYLIIFSNIGLGTTNIVLLYNESCKEITFYILWVLTGIHIALAIYQIYKERKDVLLENNSGVISRMYIDPFKILILIFGPYIVSTDNESCSDNLSLILYYESINYYINVILTFIIISSYCIYYRSIYCKNCCTYCKKKPKKTSVVKLTVIRRSTDISNINYIEDNAKIHDVKIGNLNSLKQRYQSPEIIPTDLSPPMSPHTLQMSSIMHTPNTGNTPIILSRRGSADDTDTNQNPLYIISDENTDSNSLSPYISYRTPITSPMIEPLKIIIEHNTDLVNVDLNSPVDT